MRIGTMVAGTGVPVAAGAGAGFALAFAAGASPNSVPLAATGLVSFGLPMSVSGGWPAPASRSSPRAAASVRAVTARSADGADDGAGAGLGCCRPVAGEMWVARGWRAEVRACVDAAADGDGAGLGSCAPVAGSSHGGSPQAVRAAARISAATGSLPRNQAFTSSDTDYG